MSISKHYEGHGEKVMRSMKRTYGDSETAKRVFYATENKRKNENKKGHKKSSKR